MNNGTKSLSAKIKEDPDMYYKKIGMNRIKEMQDEGIIDFILYG